MSLKEKTLFEEIDKVSKSIERIKHFEPKEGYWVGISGGKDSDVILELVKMSGVKYEAHHSLTTIDKPETIYHIRKNLPDVIIDKPEMPFLKKLESKGFPIRQARWCCEVYKEHGGDGRCVVTGIRRAESSRRASRQTFEHCLKGGKSRGRGKTYLHPIIDWTDQDVWEFHKIRGLSHCVLYDQGSTRVGCLFCPMAKHSERLADLEAYPKYKRNFIKAFTRLYENRKAKGAASIDRWESGEDMFNWWVKEDMIKKDEAPELFRFDD